MMETASYLADPKKIGVFATRDIAPGAEFWTVYGDICVGQLKGRVQPSDSNVKGEQKKEEGGRVFGVSRHHVTRNTLRGLEALAMGRKQRPFSRMASPPEHQPRTRIQAVRWT